MDAASHFRLDSKTILITGASSGIGKACAIACAEAGATVLLNGRNEHRLLEVFEALEGSGHQILPYELREKEQVSELANKCSHLHGLIHSAGIDGVAPMRQVQLKMLDNLFLINYVAAITLTQKLLAAKKISNNGSILFMSSIAAKTGKRGVGPYSGTKAALIGSMRPLALEVAKYGIRVNALCPGIVKTPLFEKQEIWLLEEVAESYPLGLGHPDDVAHAAVFFMSNASAKITGTDFSIDGGVVLT